MGSHSFGKVAGAPQGPRLAQLPPLHLTPPACISEPRPPPGPAPCLRSLRISADLVPSVPVPVPACRHPKTYSLRIWDLKTPSCSLSPPLLSSAHLPQPHPSDGRFGELFKEPRFPLEQWFLTWVLSESPVKQGTSANRSEPEWVGPASSEAPRSQCAKRGTGHSICPSESRRRGRMQAPPQAGRLGICPLTSSSMVWGGHITV